MGEYSYFDTRRLNVNYISKLIDKSKDKDKESIKKLTQYTCSFVSVLESFLNFGFAPNVYDIIEIDKTTNNNIFVVIHNIVSEQDTIMIIDINNITDLTEFIHPYYRNKLDHYDMTDDELHIKLRMDMILSFREFYNIKETKI